MQKRSRKAIITQNNPVSWKETLETLWATGEYSFITGQLEAGKNNTPHLQAYLVSYKFIAVGHLGKLKIHVELVFKDNGCAQYCNKAATRLADPVSFGDQPRPCGGDRKSAKFQEKNAKILSAPLKNLVDDGIISLYQLPHYVKAVNIYQSLGEPYIGERHCFWIHGSTGTGKSRWAHQNYPLAYIKQQNKWWDNYTNQESVLLEDVDSDSLGHDLKLWTDRYACTGETKGGTINLNHRIFVVTSNYTIEELFQKQLKMIDPLLRRFRQVKAHHPFELEGKIIKWEDQIQL